MIIVYCQYIIIVPLLAFSNYDLRYYYFIYLVWILALVLMLFIQDVYPCWPFTLLLIYPLDDPIHLIGSYTLYPIAPLTQ